MAKNKKEVLEQYTTKSGENLKLQKWNEVYYEIVVNKGRGHHDRILAWNQSEKAIRKYLEHWKRKLGADAPNGQKVTYIKQIGTNENETLTLESWDKTPMNKMFQVCLKKKNGEKKTLSIFYNYEMAEKYYESVKTAKGLV